MNPAPSRPLPQARGHWLLGSALAFAAAPHLFPAQAAARHGGIARFRVLHKPFVAVADPEHVNQVMVTRHKHYRRSFHYDNPVVGQGLLSTDGEPWLKRRRQVQPAFRRETLGHLVAVANAACDRIFEKWEAQRLAGQPIELAGEMQQLALSVIGHALFSVEVGWSNAARFARAVRDALRLLRRRNTAIVRFPHWLPTPLNRSLERTRQVLDDYLWPIIRARRAAADGGEDILGALLRVRDPESGDALADQEVLDETKTLFTAGFETTATALTWALHLLATHPEVAARWHEEADRVLGGRAPGWDDLERLPYTAQIVQETLRLYPPVYSLGRECVDDDVLGGFAVPRGSILMLSVLGIHRDPRWWPEPEAFRPERFAGDWPRQAYLPFASGRHLCVGNHFSLTEMVVVLARIAQRWRLEPVDAAPVGMRAQITLVPDRDILLRLVPR